MQNAKFVIIAVFTLTLCSGVVAGMLVSRIPSNNPSGISVTPATTEPKTAMEQTLGLNSSQQQQMQGIWENVRTTADDCYTKAQDLQKQQWDALVNILTAEQKVEFNKKDAEFRQRFDELKKQREAAFKDAVSKTDAILTESQRKQFHELIKTRVGRNMGEPPPWINSGP